MACRVRARTELALTYDISTDGCMLQASRGFCQTGDMVELTIGGHLFRGRVVWTKHRNAGVQFAQRAAETTLDAVLAMGESMPASLNGGRPHERVSRLHQAIYGILVISSALLLFPR